MAVNLSEASLDQQLRELERAQAETSRYLDLALILRRRKTQETLLWAGGQWDRLERRWTGNDIETGQIIDIEESQVEFITWFATWLADFRDGKARDTSVVMTGGSRRGGKTFMDVAVTLATVIEVPNSIGWLVAKAFPETRELDQYVRALLPTDYYRVRTQPQHEYRFPNGSIVTIESADDPERLKKGRADIVLLNEPQKVDVGAFVNALGGTIDRGGILICAANPPRKVIGQWVLDYKDMVEQGKLKGCRYFSIDAALNQSIDHGAKGVFRDILVSVDPKAAAADADGGWYAIGDVAYGAMDNVQNLRPVAEFGEMTAEVTRRKSGREYTSWGGVDFQATPHHAAVLIRAFRGPDNRPIYWAVGEVLVRGTEDDFLDECDEYGLLPEKHLWVGDASGNWQDGAHNRGRRSFDVFKARRWHIFAPQKKRTTQGDAPKNPDIADRLSLVNVLLDQKRLFVDQERCPQLAVALKKCELRHGKPFGKYAHVTDALGYALYWAEPPPSKSTAPHPAWSVPRKKQDWM